MDFWKLMVLKDDFICFMVNSIFALKNSLSLRRNALLKKMNSIQPQGKNKDLYIIFNGPSLSNQNIEKLQGKSLMFVNRGFKHPLYKQLKPEYHVFIDPKMITGEWPVTWIDEILELVPNITIVMPVSWAFLEKFKPYTQRGIKFYWINDQKPCTCLGVGGACFEFGRCQQFQNIYFTGFDATGLAAELLNVSSHFYGVNEENEKKSTDNYVTDLIMFSRHLRDLNKLAIKYRREEISIINLTAGGLLDMFPRKKLEDIK